MASTAVHATLTGIELHYSKLQVIVGSPSSIPTYIGQTQYDQTNNILYIATGISSLSDWKAQSSTANVKETSSATYSATSSDNGAIIAMTDSALRTFNLPTTPINGFFIGVQDSAATGAYTNTITVNAGGNLITGGGSTYKISSNNACVLFVFDFASSTWVISSSYIGLQPTLQKIRGADGADALNITSTNFEVLKTLVLDDVIDNTKQLTISLSSATTGTKTTLIASQTTNRSINIPDLSGTLPMLPTATPTVGQFLAAANTSGLLQWVGATNSLANVVANDSNVVFISTDNRFQNCLPTAPRTYTLPSTSILAGDTWTFYNRSTGISNFITLTASDSTVIGYCLPNGVTIIQSNISTPTNNTNWTVISSESEGTFNPSAFSGGGVYAGGGLPSITCSYTQIKNRIILNGLINNNPGGGPSSTFATVSFLTVNVGNPIWTNKVYGASSIEPISTPPPTGALLSAYVFSPSSPDFTISSEVYFTNSVMIVASSFCIMYGIY